MEDECYLICYNDGTVVYYQQNKKELPLLHFFRILLLFVGRIKQFQKCSHMYFNFEWIIPKDFINLYV